MTIRAISWPGLICYAGEDEVTYVSSLDEWLSDADLYAFDYDDEDFLVDSEGFAFQLSAADLTLMDSLETIGNYPMDALNERVRRHLAALGNCCVSKLNLSSVSMAMQSIQDSID